ncbi:bifunctional riboflavin kinase/FAD synthetase [Campylobacter helveticus]|uniref:Riboflavin biosynthesis protein n=2 Tax=Campylobacter helveticus TaxID=28898 RepID=A0AAX2UJC1_9BACT|nr:bifunctional riboflavin kinase/FAD synthetase [Campylobacter helveticus]ARE80886.1 bifunctional riboflavin kinase / FMN adenylyltransferase [Campylobacter helveticus]MCR2039697.1 bifunctional riboflavin kinase/FAD synthetase [Campylobacter helveticus]MCR2055391.1 bifunctional riboflavin kinase/FAD synthetase [Campylobacter helveticus]MCR2056579.1 bifunctional riboflavin kinase/FAD synthetase [Campylobacter helveticus]MCR2060118.1 bifunctional riboflavin kinase/FAD synthetase [Campylobacter 
MMNFSIILEKASVKTLAIGCFDGIHLGHLELIKKLDKNGALLIIDKFKGEVLSDERQKQELSKRAIFTLEFEKIRHLSARDFLEFLKKEFVNLEHIVVGYDFTFGRNKEAVAYDIEKLSKIKTSVVPEFKLEELSVHTSLIKEFLSLGAVEKARRFLGRIYSIKARLVKGQGLGKRELFATLNLENLNYFLPKNGVYASLIKVQEKGFKSVSFLGFRSTDLAFSIETHIIEEFKNAVQVGEEMELFFVKFLRENEKFSDLKALKAQISQDIGQAKEILNNER